MPPFGRIAITVPPDAWFHGIARSLFELYRQAFLDLGLAVFDVPVDAFVDPGTGRLSAVLDDLRAFQPDVAFGLSHGLYALLCRLPARLDGWRANAFTEFLDIPTICLWDHAPLELADQLLKPHPLDPAASQPDALDTLRRVLTHPRLIHWSRDSGQTRIMQDLGLLLPDRLIQENAPALPGFLPQSAPDRRPAGTGFDAGFVGHFYQEPPDYPHPLLAELAEDSIRTWLDRESLPLWDVLMHRIAALPAALRESLALVPEQTYFWPFVHHLILHRAQTSRRVKLLGAAGVPVACYGDLSAGPGVPANLASIPGHIPFGPELAATLARHPLTIDVLNPGFIHGYSHKPVLGFASGGFVLLDRKQDFVDAFGEAGEAVSYRGADGLGAKVDHFLSHPEYRREVGETIRHSIAARYQLKDVLARVLDAASRCPAATGGSPHSTRYFDIRHHSNTVQDVLPLLRSEPHWTGAGVQHLEDGALIVTPAEAWLYAAAIPIPALVDAMNEPHLRLRILVETGRIGLLAICDETGAPCSEEHFVSPHIRPVHVTVELPRLGPTTVILRNTLEGVGRAVLLEADLCDRRA